MKPISHTDIQSPFAWAIGLALLLHVVAVVWFGFHHVPKEVKVPFKTLHIKLGQETAIAQPNKHEADVAVKQRARKPIRPVAAPFEPQPAAANNMPPLPTASVAVSKPVVQRVMPVSAPAKPELPAEVKDTLAAIAVLRKPVQEKAHHSENKAPPPSVQKPRPLSQQPVVKPVVQKVTAKQPVQKPKTAVKARPSAKAAKSAEKSQRAAKGHDMGNMSVAKKLAVQNYGERLSLWLHKYREYPENAKLDGAEGVGVVYLEIERSGFIRKSELVKSTGNLALDTAIGAMLKKANPAPPFDNAYLNEELMAFRIPVDFTLETASVNKNGAHVR